MAQSVYCILFGIFKIPNNQYRSKNGGCSVRTSHELGRGARHSSPLISRDYKVQRHWAQEQHEDGCHSPVEVLDWHKGTRYPASVLDRILFAQALHPPAFPRMDCCSFRTGSSTRSGVCRSAPVTVWVYEGPRKRRVPGRDPGHLHGRSRRRSPASAHGQHPSPGGDAVPLAPAHASSPSAQTSGSSIGARLTSPLSAANGKSMRSASRCSLSLSEVEQAVGAEGVGRPHPWLRVVRKDAPGKAEQGVHQHPKQESGQDRHDFPATPAPQPERDWRTSHCVFDRSKKGPLCFPATRRE